MSLRTVLIAGASGLVGRECLHLLARDASVSDVRALVRSTPSPPADSPRVRFVLTDFEHLDRDPDTFTVDQVFCTIGTTLRTAGSQSAFRRVDFEYPLAIAQLALDRGASHFLLVSAIGARADSRIFYNRVKGELEDALRRLPFRALTIARPSFLLGNRSAPRPGEALGRLLGRLAPKRFRSVHARHVAAALVLAAREDRPGVHVLENAALLDTPVET
ncbi:MAG: NAD(P)H-binding protein [Longimicrobiales bacterium]